MHTWRLTFHSVTIASFGAREGVYLYSLLFLNCTFIPALNLWVPLIVTLARKAVSHRTKNGYCCLCSYTRACLTASGTCNEQPHVLSALPHPGLTLLQYTYILIIIIIIMFLKG